MLSHQGGLAESVFDSQQSGYTICRMPVASLPWDGYPGLLENGVRFSQGTLTLLASQSGVDVRRDHRVGGVVILDGIEMGVDALQREEADRPRPLTDRQSGAMARPLVDSAGRAAGARA